MEYEDRNQCTGEGEREREGRERGDWRLCLQDRTTCIADQASRTERERGDRFYLAGDIWWWGDRRQGEQQWRQGRGERRERLKGKQENLLKEKSKGLGRSLSTDIIDYMYL
jgi:hypothetical protein